MINIKLEDIRENGNTDISTSEIEQKNVEKKQNSCLWEWNFPSDY